MIELRRIVTHVEDIFHEFGPRAAVPLRRGAAMAVICNPFAGRFVADIAPFMTALNPLGLSLAQQLLAALGAIPSSIEGYGKAAIVGAAGEVEHGALWHAPGGYGMRAALGWQNLPTPSGGQPGNALAIVPSTKKVGAPGVTIDVPITHINASYVRSHLDAMELRAPGAPAADELVFMLVMSMGPRIHARLGGLLAAQIERWDGQK